MLSEYLAARDALLRLRGVDSLEARGLVDVLHRTLGETDGWSHAAMVAATRQAEQLLSDGGL
jgi:hypothetical protein